MKANIIIPAKGTSDRLKNKNLLETDGESLVYRACKKLLRCNNIDNVYLDTESDEIKHDIKPLLSRGLKLIQRPRSLACNDIGANEMMVYALHSAEECDLLLQTFCTSPLLRAETIDDCIRIFLDNGFPKHDSFFTTIDVQEYFWKDNKPMNFCEKELPNSFELEKMQMETHGLYGITTESLIQTKTRIGFNPMLINISKIESLDINTREDMDLIERILNAS